MVVACLLVAIQAAGCTSVIAGAGRPAPGLKPHPLTGETIKRVLLDDAALTKILGQSFVAKTDLPPRFGGPETLQQSFGTVSPIDCASVAIMMQRSAYQSGTIENAARETWWNAGAAPARVIDVAEGVVAMSSAAEAAALFGKFSQKWDTCDGRTVTIEAGRIVLFDEVTDVRVANSVLAATVMVQTRLSGSPSPAAPARPQARAIGVRGNCVVEVEVAFFSTRSPSDEGTGDINTSAIDIAHAMMDRVSQLS